ncbi:MAG: gamma-glutamyl-gamma-aminobutyrate hydrolase family protein [Gammaproteobacteria bacterium]|nr:gamma-glutamyl-gamma-aminobutyrate hydrolase family protein [Gammaproteobacteria bacterium]NND61497.1 C26 family cysteine hydrolase domain-containing family [Gammaproteobacteria bacterium]
MRRRKILVFQHVPYEPLGTLDPILRDAGFRIRYVNFGREPDARPTLDGYAGLVVLGGPMNVDQVEQYPHLATEIEMLRQAHDRGMRILGICLGAQLLAKALGGHVGPAAEKEIGWYDLEMTAAAADDPVLCEFASPQPMFQWHGDQFGLPPGATGLASSKRVPCQAFRHGDHALGLQFHLEVDAQLIERWLTLPGYAAELAALKDSIHPDQVRADTRRHIDMLEQLSQRTFGRWVDQFGFGRRRRRLHSR